MKITNTLNLPEAIVNAVRQHTYDPGQSDFTISQLLQPPQQYGLINEHGDEITEDASDRIWALLGGAIHDILDKARPSHEQGEERLYGELSGWIVGGKFDNFIYDDGILTDYKVTSAYAVKGEPKPEWVKQLNYYRWLLETNGRPVKQLRIIAILRDWSRSNAQRDKEYPERNVVTVDIPLWPIDGTIKLIARDLQEHSDALAGNWRPCRDEERWFKPGKVALMKNGRKSAVKLFDTVTLATAYAENEGFIIGKGVYSLVERPHAYPRCENYCPVAHLCDQWNGGEE